MQVENTNAKNQRADFRYKKGQNAYKEFQSTTVSHG
jgi:hypothetical protein